MYIYRKNAQYKSEDAFGLIKLIFMSGFFVILAAAIVIALNPMELLRQSRDSQRIEDLASINNAISSVLKKKTPSNLGSTSTIYVSIPDTSPTCDNLHLPSLPDGSTYRCASPSSSSLIDGNGWLPIDLTSSDQAMTQLPFDPSNSAKSGLYYTYSTNGTQYELTTQTESTKGSTPAITDGGTLPGVYEVGTNLTLTPETRDRGLVGYWSFDEGSGSTVYDRSGYNNHGTWQGTLGSQWTTGKVGSAGQFNGNDNFVDVGNVAMNVNGTISFWVLNRTQKTNGYIGFYANHPLIYGDTSGAMNMYIPFGDPQHAGKISLSLEQWTYISIVWEKTKLTLYKDGSFYSEKTITTKDSQGMGMQIGRYFNGPGTNMNGVIDEVRVYNRALSDVEIKALYTATK